MGDWTERPRMKRRSRPEKRRRRSAGGQDVERYASAAVHGAKHGRIDGRHFAVRDLTPPEWRGELVTRVPRRSPAAG